MAFSDWSTTAGSNTSVGGVSIAEGMTPGNVNNAMRAIMADAATALGTTGNPQFATIELSHASANTLAASGGNITIEGNLLYRAGGTDVPVADGGTGASTAAGARANLGAIDRSGFRNALLNGAMMVAQRGTTFASTTTPANNDDTYLLDRWILLADGNDTVDVTQATEAPTGGLYSIGLDVETANRKFGILQVIEQKNCIGLIGNTVRLTFQAKVSSTTNLDNVKAAIIAWDGTADTVTSDIISAWAIEGTNPTLVANWTYENTPANLSVTTSWAQYTLTASVDTASTTNIGVFIWSDVTATSAGEFLYITDVQLELDQGAATPFERRTYGLELAACQRYYHRRNLVSGAAGYVAQCYSTTAGVFAIQHPVTMRANPASEVSAASDFAVWTAAGADNALSTLTLSANGDEETSRYDFAAGTANLVAGDATFFHSISASAWISHDAEL